MELPKPIPGLLARDHPANRAFPVRPRTSGTLQLASPLQSRGGRSFTLPSPVLGHRSLTQTTETISEFAGRNDQPVSEDFNGPVPAGDHNHRTGSDW